MGQLIVRGLPDHIVQALKKRAAQAGRSAEAEHRAILEQALRADSESLVELSARLRALEPRQAPESAVLIRQDRDRDGTNLPS